MLVIFLYGCLGIFVVIGCNYEFMFSFNLNYFRLGLSLAMLYTVSQKNKQNYFCYNYVKLPPNPTIFDKKMANCLKLYEMHSFSTSPKSCQCTTVLIADVPNCHITL